MSSRTGSYTCSPAALREAIDRLLADTTLRNTLTAAGERIRARDGLRHAADLIEQAAVQGLHLS